MLFSIKCFLSNGYHLNAFINQKTSINVLFTLKSLKRWSLLAIKKKQNTQRSWKYNFIHVRDLFWFASEDIIFFFIVINRFPVLFRFYGTLQYLIFSLCFFSPLYSISFHLYCTSFHFFVKKKKKKKKQRLYCTSSICIV